MEGWRPERPEDAVLSACSTLISIIDGQDSKVVRFSHFSVKKVHITVIGGEKYCKVRPAPAAGLGTGHSEHAFGQFLAYFDIRRLLLLSYAPSPFSFTLFHATRRRPNGDLACARVGRHFVPISDEYCIFEPVYKSPKRPRVSGTSEQARECEYRS
ncbi:hypothetical protein BC827DRAFT_47727 [Russula dissimulans]|nr:hypothetical protein BC827DRAFT_47727 [Russula dissimulans]